MDNQTIIETQNHETILSKPSPLWPKFLGIAVLILIIIGVLFFKNNKIVAPEKNPPTGIPTPQPTITSQDTTTSNNDTSTWKTFSKDNYSFKYPSELKLEEKNNVVSITDNKTIQVATLKPEIRTVPNFEMVLENSNEDFYSLQRGEKKQLGKHIYTQRYSGAEGSGMYEYFLFFNSNESKTETIVFRFYEYNEGDVRPEDKNKPYYLSTSEKKQIVEDILKTVTHKNDTITAPTKAPQANFTCPPTEYVDCMPGPGPKNKNCDQKFLQWAQENCPNFKGAAF